MLRKVTNLGAYGKQPEDAKVIAATQFKLVFNDSSRVEQLPPAWMIDAFQS